MRQTVSHFQRTQMEHIRRVSTSEIVVYRCIPSGHRRGDPLAGHRTRCQFHGHRQQYDLHAIAQDAVEKIGTEDAAN